MNQNDEIAAYAAKIVWKFIVWRSFLHSAYFRGRFLGSPRYRTSRYVLPNGMILESERHRLLEEESLTDALKMPTRSVRNDVRLSCDRECPHYIKLYPDEHAPKRYLVEGWLVPTWDGVTRWLSRTGEFRMTEIRFAHCKTSGDVTAFRNAAVMTVLMEYDEEAA